MASKNGSISHRALWKEFGAWLPGRYYEAIAELAEEQSPEQHYRRQVLGQLQAINVRLTQIRTELAAKSEVHPTDLLVLLLLSFVGPDHTIRPTEIQRVLGFTAGGVTRRLAGMESRELVRRTHDSEDGRAWRVSLTPRGEAIAAAQMGHVAGGNERLEAEFSIDEWAMMANLLDRFAKTLG